VEIITHTTNMVMNTSSAKVVTTVDTATGTNMPLLVDMARDMRSHMDMGTKTYSHVPVGTHTPVGRSAPVGTHTAVGKPTAAHTQSALATATAWATAHPTRRSASSPTTSKEAPPRSTPITTLR